MPAVTFSLVSTSADFTVDSATGKLATKKPISYNDKKTIDVTVVVTTTAMYPGLDGKKYTDACVVRIQVVDKNQAPVLSDTSFDLKENVVKDTVVGTVVATDTDTNSFAYDIASVMPVAWTEALKIDNAGKIEVNDPKLINYEALAAHDFRIALQVTVTDNHPDDSKTATATVTVKLVDLPDLTLEPDPASPTLNSLRTEGGEDACFVGSGFSELSQVKSGESWKIAATYTNGNNGPYTASQCETRGLTKICCKAAPGVGSSHTWSFQLMLPSSVSGLPVVSRMVKTMSFATIKTTSYEKPYITSLKGAVNMGTSGGDTVDIVGRNLGPVGTNGVATYVSMSGDLVKEVSCTSVLPLIGRDVVMRCTSQPGFGGPLRWRIVVGGQESQWTVFSDGGNPTSSYAGPEVTRVDPTSGPTVGGYSIMITGINFALRSSVSIGPYRATIIRSNYTHIEAVVRGGMGQNLQVEVRIGNLTSPDNTVSGVFSYDAPSIQNVSVISRGVVCGSSSGRSSMQTTESPVLHGCTQGGTVLMLTGKNFGPSCKTSDEATASDHACACGIRLGGRTVCTVPVKSGSWCVPRVWGHSEIRCDVQPGAGGNLRVGIVAAGIHHYAETSGHTFSYDAPVVHEVTPSEVLVDGGQIVSITGDNFGPAGTPVVVQPANALECDHTNTSHTLVRCVVKQGRGAGMPVRVSVGGQKSADTGANISYSFPKITSVDPSRGSANNPERLTIRGDNFGNNRVSVRIFLGKEPCGNALWMPATPPEFPNSYLLCEPPDGDTSGSKSISLEFFVDETFVTSLYPELKFTGLYAVICSKGEYTSATNNGACELCPIGATCEGADAMPIALPGYMQIGNASSSLAPGGVASAIVRFTKCTPEAACQGGGACAVGYVTPDNSCVGCAKRFYKLSGECKPCPDSAGLLLGIYIAVILILGVAGQFLVKKGPSLAVAGIGIDYFQVLSVFTGLDVGWPKPVKDVLNAVSISNMNIELVSPQCTIAFSYDQKWLAIEFAPLGLVLLGGIGYVFVLAQKQCAEHMKRRWGWKTKDRSHGEMHRHSHAIIGSLIMMFQVAYIYCTKTAFEVFACETKENGKSYMSFEPEIECWTGTHNTLWPLALCFASIYGIGIPMVFTAILYRNRKLIKGDQILRVLGIGRFRGEGSHEYYEFRKRFYKLYYRYKPQYHYWGQIIFLRKFLIVLTTVFMKWNATLQTTCVLLILFLSYTTHVRVAPYLRNDLLGDSTDNDVNLDAIKELAVKQTSMSKEERTKSGSFFSFVNRGRGSVLRRASSLKMSAVAPTRSGKSHSPPRAGGGGELVERRPQDSSSGSESKNTSDAAAVDAAVDGAQVSQEQRVHPQSRPKHAKLTKDKERRLSRLLRMDVDHAAFNESTSTGIWTALGAKEGLRRGDSFMKNSGKPSTESALSFKTSKKFAMVRATCKG
jgi:hypothetical protein